jgi:hypothetical protein
MICASDAKTATRYESAAAVAAVGGVQGDAAKGRPRHLHPAVVRRAQGATGNAFVRSSSASRVEVRAAACRALYASSSSADGYPVCSRSLLAFSSLYVFKQTFAIPGSFILNLAVGHACRTAPPLRLQRLAHSRRRRC